MNPKRAVLAAVVSTLLLLQNNAVAQSYSYSASGYSSKGYVYGDIDASRGSRDVDGYIYDSEGNAKYFNGEWVRNGVVEGYDEDGNYVELEVD
jgi:hypothetical protein